MRMYKLNLLRLVSFLITAQLTEAYNRHRTNSKQDVVYIQINDEDTRLAKTLKNLFQEAKNTDRESGESMSNRDIEISNNVLEKQDQDYKNILAKVLENLLENSKNTAQGSDLPVFNARDIKLRDNILGIKNNKYNIKLAIAPENLLKNTESPESDLPVLNDRHVESRDNILVITDNGYNKMLAKSLDNLLEKVRNRDLQTSWHVFNARNIESRENMIETKDKYYKKKLGKALDNLLEKVRNRDLQTSWHVFNARNIESRENMIETKDKYYKKKLGKALDNLLKNANSEYLSAFNGREILDRNNIRNLRSMVNKIPVAFGHGRYSLDLDKLDFDENDGNSNTNDNRDYNDLARSNAYRSRNDKNEPNLKRKSTMRKYNKILLGDRPYIVRSRNQSNTKNRFKIINNSKKKERYHNKQAYDSSSDSYENNKTYNDKKKNHQNIDYSAYDMNFKNSVESTESGHISSTESKRDMSETSNEYENDAYIQGNILIKLKDKRDADPATFEDYGQGGRRRLPNFLPKRYHWDPREFDRLGYFWFNGPKGKFSWPVTVN